MESKGNGRQLVSSPIPVSWIIAIFAILVGIIVTFKKRSTAKLAKPSPTPSNEGNDKVTLKPEKWVKVATVKSLLIYPIKSCAGFSVDKAVITTLGLRCQNSVIRDRDFLVIDEDDQGKQVTAGKYSEMILIKVTLGDGGQAITLNAPDMPTLTVTVPEANGQNERVCRIDHDRNVKALDCGDKAAHWIQEFLGNSSLRLVYHHLNHTQRTMEKYAYKCPLYVPTDVGSFQNETSQLVVAEESIQELNKRLDKESSWKNWRPTILIDGVSEPFAEINWSFLRFGNKNGILKGAVPCNRCPTTTIDNDTGIKPIDGEPLKTLREMNVGDTIADKRLESILKNRGVMGLRCGLYMPAGEGAVISVGDPVYAALL